eukprot:1934446-Pyramimonas_sp.AAC.3
MTKGLDVRVMQADDETEFSVANSATQQASELTKKLADLSRNVKALLEDACDAPVPLGEQAVALHALLSGKALNSRQ